MSKLQPDKSTINWQIAESHLRKVSYMALREKHLKLDDHMGAACFLDAPGYPSYFIQSVYTARGDSPQSFPDQVLVGPDGSLYDISHRWGKGKSWDEVKAEHDKTLHALWERLPEDSERVQIWIKVVYQHFAHCYSNPELRGQPYPADATVIWPVPYYQMPIDPRKAKVHLLGETLTFADLKPETQAAKLKAYRAEKKEIIRRAWDVCRYPDNHSAVAWIRRFYPTHRPRLDYIQNPPSQFQTDWVERYDHQPSPDECPGHLDSPHGRFDNCRLCGRTDIGPMERAKTAGGK